MSIHSWLQCSTDTTSKAACHIHALSLHSWDWNLISEHFIYFYFSFRNVFTPVITSWTEVTGSGKWLITSQRCRKLLLMAGGIEWKFAACSSLVSPRCGSVGSHSNALCPLKLVWLLGCYRSQTQIAPLCSTGTGRVEDWMEREELEVRGKGKDRGFYMLLLLTWQNFWLLSASVRSNPEA